MIDRIGSRKVNEKGKRITSPKIKDRLKTSFLPKKDSTENEFSGKKRTNRSR